MEQSWVTGIGMCTELGGLAETGQGRTGMALWAGLVRWLAGWLFRWQEEGTEGWKRWRRVRREAGELENPPRACVLQ